MTTVTAHQINTLTNKLRSAEAGLADQRLHIRQGKQREVHLRAEREVAEAQVRNLDRDLRQARARIIELESQMASLGVTA